MYSRQIEERLRFLPAMQCLLNSGHLIQLLSCYVTKLQENLAQRPIPTYFLLFFKCLLELRLLQITFFTKYLTYLSACWVHFNLLGSKSIIF